MKQIRTTIESPYEPNDNSALWLDTSNPDAPILKAFTNGKWQATIGGEKVTEISGDSTDEEIPSAKAVNDRIIALADEVGVDLDKYKEYFTIEATEDETTVYFRQSTYAENYGLEPLKVDVSTDDGQTWREVTASSLNNGIEIASLNAGDKVLIRGNNPAYGYNDADEEDIVENCNFLAYQPCYVYGNIMSLVSKEGFEELRSVDEYAFLRFFSDYDLEFDWSWVLSKDGAELLLPATTLAEYCYAYMFMGCTSLTAVPALPATSLANSCYFNMFHGCTSLSIAPELPATTLADECYMSIFSGCTSLTSAPKLPVTSLTSGCYEYMFQGCTSLTIAPELPATTLIEYCYNGMFYNCTNLVSAPELPATTLAEACYSYMFHGCTSLTTAPILPSTTLTPSCYEGMFQGCTSLTIAPSLPATTFSEGCYNNLFHGCTSLTYIKALFLTTPSNSYTRNWVEGVNATGTFVKSTNATWNVTGDDGVPSGWTIKKGESTGNVPVTTAPMGLTEAQKEQVRENIGVMDIRPIVMSALPEEGATLEDLIELGLDVSEIRAAAEGKRLGVLLGSIFCGIDGAEYVNETAWTIGFSYSNYNSDGSINAMIGAHIEMYGGGTLEITIINI